HAPLSSGETTRPRMGRLGTRKSRMIASPVTRAMRNVTRRNVMIINGVFSLSFRVNGNCRASPETSAARFTKADDPACGVETRTTSHCCHTIAPLAERIKQTLTKPLFEDNFSTKKGAVEGKNFWNMCDFADLVHSS